MLINKGRALKLRKNILRLYDQYEMTFDEIQKFYLEKNQYISKRTIRQTINWQKEKMILNKHEKMLYRSLVNDTQQVLIKGTRIKVEA